MTRIDPRNYPESTAQRLTESGIPSLLARIYAARGIEDVEQLEIDLKKLLPFTLLKQAEDMASALADAIATGKKLLIVADYDADGATACAVGMRGLTALGAKVDFIVPNRFEYGYGLTPEIVRLAATMSPDILLTVDNGIASVDGVAEAHRLGMQVLVTDHHLPGDTLPDAECIVNPSQPGCPFPSKNLAGVGVMFYVLMALRAELRTRGAFADKPEPNLGNLLDLVALGTVADVVKLDDNNRILVHQGLQRIRTGRACLGIMALLRIARRPAAQASSYELGFIVGPRLNAAGRLEDMGLGIRCLLTDDANEANEIAAKLDALNLERRSIEADMQDTALATLETFDPAESYSLALFNDEWHQGVIGILASRLKDKFHRPVIAFARAQTGELKGSGRSIPGLHLRDALDLVSKRQPHLILKFGGHAMAAGLSIPEDALDAFRIAFESVVQEMLDSEALVRSIATDGELEAQEFSLGMARELQAQVWGQGFPEPLFEGAFRVQTQRIVGEKHLKLKLTCSAGSFDAIRFFHADTAPDTVHAVYSLSINEYNGSETLQLIVRHW
ncbi:MAG: single-stranded-DNA-specific exonuclease RecJ [Gammaproteobacteria bacterium]|nr:single-stranded-DNA-specific exonuclease RecJ [Gammaproteobacteria bacterium]MBU1625140.1 single-stranded-DNA-specific exonuclease RecJ [Gammaproteobacteria bacterium]MBU1981400.1 single-stranded-DNA-specific exonuclease RecJ [Gammaproteobacteria bacterium]